MAADASCLDPAHVLLAGVRDGRWTASALVDIHLERIATCNPALNAVVALDASGARATASRLDAHWRRHGPVGPLHGLPMTIKDSIAVAGLPLVCGAPALRDHRPPVDAVAVARLRAAGAVILGKSNVPLYASDFQTFNEVHGRSNNPWAPDRTPGGSSGGAAAALAAGMTAAELGSDLAGSLRLPAHACGVASLKPSHGAVPLAGSLGGPPDAPPPRDLWVLGPLARTVADLVLLFEVIAGGDQAGTVAPHSAPPPDSPLRLAVWIDEPGCPPAHGVRAVLEAAVRAIAALPGVTCRDDRPDFSAEDAFALHCTLMYAEMSGGLPDDVIRHFVRRAARGVPAGDEVAALQTRGLTLSHRDWLRLSGRRTLIERCWSAFFAGHDALLCPVAPTVAALHDETRLDRRRQCIDDVDYPALRHCFWASLASLAGLPAVTLPAGLDIRGLPVGLQLIGPRWSDRRLLAIAARLEAVLGGFRPPPAFAG